MKRIGIVVGAIAMTGFVSCEKCEKCHYESGNAEVEVGELCGEDLEDAENIGYYDTNTDSLYDVHCGEH
jgi:hypothetical protein